MKASRELTKKFYDGFKQDRAMGKVSRGLVRVLSKNKGNIIDTMVEIVLSPKLQDGLLWAAENDVLRRSIEQLMIDHIDEFKGHPDIDKVAKWRIALAKEKVA